MELRDPLDFDTTRQRVFDSIPQGLAERYPIENDRYRLEVADLGYTGPEKFSLKEQKRAILSRNTLGRPLKGTVRLIDKETGDVVDKKRTTLAKVPYMTRRGTFILGGTEYTVAQQMRLKPGVYTRAKDSGELEAHFNVVKGGPSFRVFMDPDSGAFKMQVGQAKLPLYPILKAAGATDKDMQQWWGRDLYTANVYNKDNTQVLNKVWSRFSNARAKKETNEPVERNFRALLENLELDPSVTKYTLGKDYRRITPEVLLRATQKLRNISSAQEDTDDRDSLMYQTTWSVDDLLKERVTKDAGRTLSRALWKATMRKNLKGLNAGYHNPQIDSVFFTSGMGQPLEEINTLDAMDQNTRITRMGEGGIPSSESVPEDARSVQPSHLGFIDPVKTPESGNIGVDTRIAMGALKGDDNQLYTPVRDPRSGRKKMLNPAGMAASIIAFPGEMAKAQREGRKYVKAMKHGKMDFVKARDVNYEIPAGQNMFTVASNMVPAISGIKGGRLLMGAKYVSQALPLREADVPLVQPDAGDGQSIYSKMGKYAGAVRSNVSGIVTKVTPDEIEITDAKGQRHTQDIYNNFPLNRKTYMNSTPVVHVGERVNPKSMLAKSNFTNAKGDATVGKNMRVGYMPFRGMNYEDAIVISESAAKKFTSEHMYTERMDTDSMRKLDKNKYRALFPSEFDKAQYAKIGDDGVAKKGQIVNQGDPLILSVRRRSPKGAGQLSRGGDYALSEGSVTWHHPFPGVVTDKWIEKDGVKVAVQAFAPAEKGDKLAGFYGDKGVISQVVPDDQMPVAADGKSLEVLLNPLGIITRINPSQVVEAVLGKVAEKRGHPYVLPPFMDKNLIDYAVSEMDQYGVSDTEDLLDPTTDKKIPRVLVGRRYLMKLQHTAESKQSDRALGTYSMEGAPAYSEEEGNPKRVGMGEMQALISHGAIQNIKDIKNIKGQQNDEYWRAMSLGYDPPTPQMPSAYKKFTNMLRAAGINIQKDGNKLHLTAMTDKDVDKFSGGKITNPGTVRWIQEYKRGVFGEKSMEPVEGGLFDRGVTGGHGGSKFAHIELSEPMPSPVMEDPIRRLLGLTGAQYEDVIAGERDIPGYGTGGKAVRNALARIDVKKSVTDLEQEVKTATSASARDNAVKKLGYMRTFLDRGVKPEDMVITKVPVLPPIFRPITATNKFNMVAGANMLYADLMNADAQLAAATKTFEGAPVTDARRAVYRSIKAVIGLGDPVKPERKQQRVKGILKSVLGTNPKVGVFQRRLLGTSVDLAGRATITPNSALNIDQVGVPEESAWKLYGPFAVRRLVRGMGGDANAKVHAVRNVAQRTSTAREALEAEMKKRPILATRAPALHRYSLMAFEPVIARGRTLELPPAVTPGFNADFDGDAMNFHVVVSEKAIREAREKLLPSANLRAAADFKPLWLPRQEFVQGLYTASTAKTGKRMVPAMDNDKAVIEAFKRGDLNIDDVVSVRS
jgi:DNA-directed RNA polymerase subunit beta